MKYLKTIFTLSGLFFIIFTYAQNPETQIMYLSGTGPDDAVEWDFFCTAGRKSGFWKP